MPERILIVEDSPTQAERLGAHLAAAGYEVATAASGEAALARVDAEAFDVVLTDVVMPGMGGYDLCRAIKSRSATLPVVLLTTLSDPVDIIRGLQAGADNFVTKPYDPVRLVEQIQSLLRTRRARAQSQTKVDLGVRLVLMDREFVITAEREQILDLLVTTFDQAVAQNTQLRARERELTAAQAALRRHARALEVRLDRVLASIPDAVFSVDADWDVVRYASPSVAQVFGCQPEEFHPRLLLDQADPEDRQVVQAAMTDVARAPDPVTFEARITGLDATARVVACTLVRAVDEHEGDRIDGIARDVTDLRAAEARLREAEVQLRHSQKVEVVGRMAGSIAHDFNNLITVIIGEIDLLLTDPATSDVYASLQEIQAVTQRAAELTRRILTFTRREITETAVLAPAAVLDGMRSLLQRVAGERIRVAIEVSPAAWTVRMDKGHLEQVIMNLAVNARDAMVTDGGTLTIRVVNETVTGDVLAAMPGLTPGEYVAIAVTDTGVGIGEDALAHLFEPFFTTKDVGRGTGLGLATAHGIVNEAGGTIQVHTKPGAGTTMTVYLPRSRGTTVDVHATPSRPGEPPARHTGSVLVVDDEDSVRRVVATTLRRHGYDVRTASTVPEAMRMLRLADWRADLLLTDLVLPTQSGIELARDATALQPGLRILLMSGYGPEDWTERGETPFAVLQKPFTPDALTRKVAETLAGDDGRTLSPEAR